MTSSLLEQEPRGQERIRPMKYKIRILLEQVNLNPDSEDEIYLDAYAAYFDEVGLARNIFDRLLQVVKEEAS